MIYIILLAALAAAVLLITEPRMIEASAQTPKDSKMSISAAKEFSFSRDVIVNVRGESTKHLNIFDGSKVKARKLSDGGRKSLLPKDVVIIKSKSGNGNNPYRLRQIDKIEDGRVYFKNPPVSEFQELKSRDLCAVFAKVTHIENRAA